MDVSTGEVKAEELDEKRIFKLEDIVMSIGPSEIIGNSEGLRVYKIHRRRKHGQASPSRKIITITPSIRTTRARQ